MDDKEVGTFFESHILNVKMLSNFIDYDEIEEPVQNLVAILDNKLYKDVSKQLVIKARLHTLTLMDSILQLWS